MDYKRYTRQVDAGHGEQELILNNGIVIEQRLISHGNHHYTGDGNQEFVGLPIRKVNKLANGEFKRDRRFNVYDYLESTAVEF